MAVISDVLGAVNAAVEQIGQGVFSSVAGSVLPVVQVGSVLVIALTGINLMIQAVPMTLANGVSLAFRIAVVFLFVSNFGNFFPVYSAITDTPSEFGAVILQSITGGRVTNLYAGLDALYAQSLNVGQAVSQNGSYIAGAIAGLVMFVISALMATISIIVICASKLMIGVLVIIAPLAIATTLFKATAPIFEAYVKLAIGFALVPLLAAAMAGFTIMTANAVTPQSMSTVEAIGDIVSFIVVMMLGTGLMLMVPSIAQSLAMTGIGIGAVAFSTYAQGRAAGGAAGGSAKATGAAGRGVYEAVRGKALGEGASKARAVGFASTNVAMRLFQRMKTK